jgi:DNA mismatch repair protein MutL
VRVPLSGRGEDRLVRILGQYKGALVLLEAEDALLLLDQHAAHERILYEKLSRSFARQQVETQRLLVPRLLELSTAEALGFVELLPALRQLGFVIEPLSGSDFSVSGVPGALEDREAEELLARLASSSPEARDVEAVTRRLLEELAAERACKGAIKIHERLSMTQMEQLVTSLFACDDPFACPHGRPTLLEMTDADLERRFGRRG